MGESVGKGSWLERHGRKVNVLCNVCVVLLCLVALATFAARWRDQPKQPSLPRLGVAVGQNAGGHFGKNDTTILAALSSQNNLCAREVSVYRELEKRYADRRGLGFVYLMTDAVAAGRHFLAETGLGGTPYFSQNLANWGVRDVPFLIVLDQHGVVRFSVNGALNPAQRKELESVLAR